MPDYPFGIDVSRWQGVIDWDMTIKGEPKVLFAGMRASISWGYQDSFFVRNWVEAKRVGIIRMAYHVVYPVDSPVKQIDNFLRIVGSDLGEFPLVLDVELDQGQTPGLIAASIEACSNLVLAKLGRKPILYSRAQWIDYYVTGGIAKSPPDWLNKHDWWLAHYRDDGTEHAGPPPLPRGVSRERCIIHQTSRKGNGKYYGMASYDLDLNRWQGDLASLMKYAGKSMDFTFEEKVDLLWDIHPEIHKEGM